MEYPKQMRVPMSETMFNNLSEIDNKVQFIRDAINEKLGLEKKEIDSTFKIIRQLEKLNPETVLKKLVDLELLNQYLFEELRKQNELMKLIHRRSTLGSRLSSLIFDNIKDKPTRIHEEKLATIKIDEEIANLKI